MEKLCRSFGQDVLESLYWAATDWRGRRARRTLAVQFLIATVYASLHAMLLHGQAITLNVAINSESHMLLTLLVSNQFMELKTCVFKKYDRGSLFLITCSDMVERFQLVLFLCIVVLKNFQDLGFQFRAGELHRLIFACSVQKKIELLQIAFMFFFFCCATSL